MKKFKFVGIILQHENVEEPEFLFALPQSKFEPRTGFTGLIRRQSFLFVAPSMLVALRVFILHHQFRALTVLQAFKTSDKDTTDARC